MKCSWETPYQGDNDCYCSQGGCCSYCSCSIDEDNYPDYWTQEDFENWKKENGHEEGSLGN